MTIERMSQVADALFKANEINGVHATFIARKDACYLTVDTPDVVMHEFSTGKTITKGEHGAVCVDDDTDLTQGETFLRAIVEGRYVYS